MAAQVWGEHESEVMRDMPFLVGNSQGKKQMMHLQVNSQPV